MAKDGSAPVARPRVGLFADPLGLPPQVPEVLDQRSGVVSGFIGAAGLVVAVAALLLRARAGRGRSAGAVIAGNP